MTQHTFAPAPVPEQPYTDQAGGSRRALLVAGGLVAALALGGGGYVLLSGGSSEPELSAGPVHQLPTGSKPAAKPATKAAVKPAKLPPTTSVPYGRDPFLALYLAPAAAAPATSTASGTGTTTPTAPTTPTTSTGSSPTTPEAPKVYKLVLTKVSGGTATFSVGGKLMLAKVGSVFGPTAELKLLDLTDTPKGWVATIQVGDSEPVDALKGQTLYVR